MNRIVPRELKRSSVLRGLSNNFSNRKGKMSQWLDPQKPPAQVFRLLFHRIFR